MKTVYIFRSYYGFPQTFGTVTVPAYKFAKVSVAAYEALDDTALAQIALAQNLKRLSIGTAEEEYDDTNDVKQTDAGQLQGPFGSINLGSVGLSNVSYDGSSRVLGFRINGIDYTVTYAPTSMTVAGSDGSSKVINLDGSGRVIGVA